MWKFTPPLGALPHPLFLHQGVLSFRVAKNQVIDLKKSQSVLCSPRGVPIVVDEYDTKVKSDRKLQSSGTFKL